MSYWSHRQILVHYLIILYIYICIYIYMVYMYISLYIYMRNYWNYCTMFAPRPYKASEKAFMSLSLIYDDIYIYNINDIYIYIYTVILMVKCLSIEQNHFEWICVDLSKSRKNQIIRMSFFVGDSPIIGYQLRTNPKSTQITVT